MEYNGSTPVILYKLGRIEATVENTERRVCKIEQQLESNPSLDLLKDLSGFLTALAVVVLAVAGKYDLLGALLGK